MEHVVILGASRGLGGALYRLLEQDASLRVSGFSRRGPLVADFASDSGLEAVLQLLRDDPADRVFCVAGGGPYGAFESKSWKDHQWAMDVTFHFPAKILYFLGGRERRPQVVLTGSSVAEGHGDKNAASYCAAKHALVGLYKSLRLEKPNWDVRLFSPGYMDTDLLPAHAAPRKNGVYSPEFLAKDLWQWSLTGESGSHKMWPNHPE